MKRFCFFTALLIFSSCTHEKEGGIDLNKMIQFDEKTGVLKIKKDEKHLIKKLEISSGKYTKQRIILDTSSNIGVIENLVSIDGNSQYLNTWTGFDNQSNFDHRESYYYETSLGNEHGKAYVDCFLPNFMFANSKCYVLLNSFDDQFRSNNLSDTLWFDEDFRVRIPIKSYKVGLNNVKFIIVEEGFEESKARIKKTYVNKDFIVAKRA